MAAQNGTNGRKTLVPRVDIVEGEDKSTFYLLVDLPNIDGTTLDLQVERNVLALTARTKEQAPEGELWFNDMPAGEYKRSFTLSNAIDSSKIEADLKDGVLTITLPKSEAIRPKRIEIQGVYRHKRGIFNGCRAEQFSHFYGGTRMSNAWNWKKKRLPAVGEGKHAVATLQDQMNKLLNDFFSSPLIPEFVSDPINALGERLSGFNPSVSVERTGLEILVTVEVPGMDEKDIELSLTNESLTIRGERKNQSEGKKTNWQYSEMTFGAFERIIPFSANEEIDEDRVEAVSSKGIVTIRLPLRAPATQPSAKKVTIRPA